MKKLFIALLAVTAPLAAEIVQTVPREREEDSGWSVTIGEGPEELEGFQRLSFVWDAPPPDEAGKTLFIQMAREVREGEPGWKPWAEETPENRIWRGPEPETQMVFVDVWQRTKEWRPQLVGGTVKMADRFLGMYHPDDEQAIYRVRAVGFENGVGVFLDYASPDWVSIRTSEWSDPVEVQPREDKLPVPEGFARDITAVLHFTIETSTSLESGTWQPLVQYHVPKTFPREFFRVTTNGKQVLAVTGP